MLLAARRAASEQPLSGDAVPPASACQASSVLGGNQRAARGPSAALGLAILALILCFGAVLRLRSLDAFPLWWDEGNNAFFAHQSLRGVVEMSRLTRDTDPPVHRLALGLWLRLLGSSVTNLRLFSVVCGLLTIALLYHWAARLAGRWVGLLAAALGALSPVCVYYAREAKGYPLATLLAALSTYAWACHVDTRDRRWPLYWVVYVLAGALALGTHYYILFLSVAQGLWLLGSVLGGDRRCWRGRLWRWGSGQLLIAAMMMPWVLLTGRAALAGASGLPVEGGAIGLWQYLLKMGLTLAAGPHAATAPAMGALLALGIGGVLSLRSRMPQRFLLATIVIVSLSLGYLLQRSIPFAEGRFFLYVMPALFLLVAAGVVRLGWLGALPALALLLCWGLALPDIYRPLALAEEDLRPLAARIEAVAQPGDQVIVGYIWQEGMMRVYAPDLAVDYKLGWYTSATVADEMIALFAEHPRVWLLSYRMPLQHEDNLVGWWLEHNAARALYAEYGYNRLALYTSPCASPRSSAPAALFGDTVIMRYEPLFVETKAGDVLAFSLEWSIRETVKAPITVFVHLTDDSGTLQAQSDGLPVNGMRPFSGLTVGESLRDCRALLLPQDLATGSYELWVGLYDTQSGDRRLASGPGAAGDYVVLGSVVLR